MSTTAIQGLTTAELGSLTGSQLGEFTAAQIAAMNAQQSAFLNPVAADVARLESNGSLSFNSLLTILDDASVGGMTASKFSALQSLAGKLNAAGGITTSAYAQQMFADVVMGNSANAFWNGGSSTAKALGNLSATSSQTQVQELIGKWFLGTDLPSMDLSSVGGGNIPVTYQPDTQPLFGSTGPSYADINQGDVGDCYFLSSLGEVALQDPSLIKNMIQSNGDGAYSVEFWINGKSDYVTVNDMLPTMSNGYKWGNGSSLLFDNSSTAWAPLIEKAYAQLMEQTSVQPGATLGQHGDSYADTTGGWGQCLTEIADQPVTTLFASSTESPTSLSALLGTLQGDFSSDEEIIMGTSGQTVSGNLVASHMFMVLGANASAGTINLANPWGTNVSSGMSSTFTASIASLAADNVTFYATSGHPAIA